jgi:hypothetical protein
MNEYLIEFLGALVISYALVFTHENPFIIGLTHTSILYIAKNNNLDAYFFPLSVIVEFFLNRIDFFEFCIRIGIQTLAALSIVLIYSSKILTLKDL